MFLNPGVVRCVHRRNQGGTRGFLAQPDSKLVDPKNSNFLNDNYLIFSVCTI